MSMLDLHTVHLKCFCSFMCPLNVFQTYIKNFNRKLFPGGRHMQDRRTDRQKAHPLCLASPPGRDKNLLFFSGSCWPLHKIQGHQCHRNVSKCSPHHNGDICTTRGNNLQTSFSYMSQNVKKRHILGYFGGPSMIRLGLSCFPAILSPISMCMSNKETNW